MSAIRAHAASILAQLRPGEPSARRSYWSLAMGVLALLAASRGLFGPEIPDRLVGSLWLLLPCAGLSALRRAGWAPQDATPTPLPIRPATRAATEIAVYLALVVPATALPALLLAGLRIGLTRAWLGQAPSVSASLVAGGAGLAFALLLALPLLVACAPDEGRHGPMALTRLLLPWLPVGIAAPLGWLETIAGLLATAGAMWLTTGILLALRRTGWEEWWPRMPDLSRHRTPARDGLPPETRLALDLREGLRASLGLALLLAAPGWLLMLATVRGWLPETFGVAAILLLAAAFLLPMQSTLRLPFWARVPAWKPPALPWLGLPLPAGAFQLRMLDHQGLAWLVLAAVHVPLMLALYHGQPGTGAQTLAAEMTLGMVLVALPPIVAWEARFVSSPRPPGGGARVAFIALALLSFWAALAASTALVRGWAPGWSDAAMGWVEASQRLAAALGPAALVGFVWLALGRILVMRDVTAQRRG